MKKSYVQAQQRREGGMRYKHDLGQNFLYDTALLRSLVASTGVTKDDCVLEIGAGAGTLTACLCEAAKQVVSVEVDEAVLPFLRVAVEGYDNITIVQGDIRRQNLRELTKPLGDSLHIIANIPYNITTPILELFWGSGLPVRQMAVMIQKEVAEKLLARPGDEGYGLTSIRCQFYCEPEIAQIVPASAFTPPPKVDSAFVLMPFREQPPAHVEDEALLWRLVRAGFNLRRKTLTNALKGATTLGADELKDILVAQGLSPTARAEELSVEQWIAVANAVKAAMQA